MRSAVVLVVVALVAVASAQRGGRDNTLPDCVGKVADVFFVLDSSTSIWVEDYKRVLTFFSQVITRFDVSRDDTRIGALSFSVDYQVGFDLGRFRSKGEVLSAIDERNLPYKTGVTNTDLAIQYVRENNVFRQDITKVIVVITDGGSRNQANTRRQADLAREAGFHMVVVGVGQYQDEREWRDIASDPDNDYIYNITNFDALGALVDSMPRRICLMPPIIRGGDCRVTEDADLMFLAAPDGINNALDVIEELRESFRPRDRLLVRYVMEVCSDGVDSGFQGAGLYCDRFGDALAQDDETYVNLVTQLRNAATSLRAQRSANQVAVLFIDDQSMRANRFGILQEVRNAAQFDGIEIIVVDLGVRDYSNFVTGMTQNRNNVINFQRQTLPQTVRQVLDRVCEGVNLSFGIGPPPS